MITFITTEFSLLHVDLINIKKFTQSWLLSSFFGKNIGESLRVEVTQSFLFEAFRLRINLTFQAQFASELDCKNQSFDGNLKMPENLMLQCQQNLENEMNFNASYPNLVDMKWDKQKDCRLSEPFTLAIYVRKGQGNREKTCFGYEAFFVSLLSVPGVYSINFLMCCGD